MHNPPGITRYASGTLKFISNCILFWGREESDKITEITDEYEFMVEVKCYR